MAVDLVFTKLVFTLRLDSESRDPYALFILKNRFRDAFRETVCRSNGECACCSEHKDCVFQAVFAQGLAPDPVARKRHQKPPLPFVFHIPLLPWQGGKSVTVELGLVVVGTAMNYLSAFRNSVIRMFRAETGMDALAAEVVALESEGCSGFRSPLIFENESPRPVGFSTISADDLIALNTHPSDRIGLRFISPLRVAREGRFLRGFSFSPFVRTLLRRISSLAYYYYGSALEMDFQRLARMSETVIANGKGMQWVSWKPGPLEGIVGSAMLSGDLTDFFPALLLGEYFSCGKGAAFGLGRYELFPTPEGEGGPQW